MRLVPTLTHGRSTLVAVLLGLLALVPLTGLAAYAWTATHPHVITTTTRIRATPAHVWSVLADRAAYPEWNPSIILSEGDLVVGGRLHNEVRSGDGTMTFDPVVLAADPGRELRWIGRLWVPGLADGEHSFVISDLGDGSVEFTQEETFVGALVPFAGATLDLQDDFDAVNAALKERVEARVASAP